MSEKTKAKRATVAWAAMKTATITTVSNADVNNQCEPNDAIATANAAMSIGPDES